MTLRAANGSSAAAIAGHVTMAMAAAAGFTPLRAERARASLAQALAACTGAVELGLAAEPGLVTARIRAAPEQLAEMGRLLAELAPERVDDRLGDRHGLVLLGEPDLGVRPAAVVHAHDPAVVVGVAVGAHAEGLAQGAGDAEQEAAGVAVVRRRLTWRPRRRRL